MTERIPQALCGVAARGRVTVIPRDGGIVVRLRGPYNTPDVDYWPTTGTCAQIVAGKMPVVYRGVSPEFAEHLAFWNAVRIR